MCGVITSFVWIQHRTQHVAKFKFYFLELSGIFFLNSFDPQLIESMDVEATNTLGCLYPETE